MSVFARLFGSKSKHDDPVETPHEPDEYDQHRDKVEKQMDEIRRSLRLLQYTKDAQTLSKHRTILRGQINSCNNDIAEFNTFLDDFSKKHTRDTESQAARVKAGEDWMKAVREEITQVTTAMSTIHAPGMQQGDANDDVRAERQRKRREKRKTRHQHHDGSSGDEDWGVDLQQQTDLTLKSGKEQDFEKKKDKSFQQEEEMLKMISQGLTGLENSAKTLNTSLKEQQELIGDVEMKMNREKGNLDTMNKRLDGYL